MAGRDGMSWGTMPRMELSGVGLRVNFGVRARVAPTNMGVSGTSGEMMVTIRGKIAPQGRSDGAVLFSRGR